MLKHVIEREDIVKTEIILTKLVVTAITTALVFVLASCGSGMSAEERAESAGASSSYVSFTVQINNVNFPDEVFRRYVASNFDVDNDG